MAVGAGMVIDAFPVYFNYEGRTWLVEFWKGQYGINTGGEVGIYHAKGVIPPHAYHTVHFEAVSDAELPGESAAVWTRQRKRFMKSVPDTGGSPAFGWACIQNRRASDLPRR